MFGARFIDADLADANLTDVDNLHKAKFDGANLKGTILDPNKDKGAHSLKGIVLDKNEDKNRDVSETPAQEPVETDEPEIR